MTRSGSLIKALTPTVISDTRLLFPTPLFTAICVLAVAWFLQQTVATPWNLVTDV